MPDNLTLEQYTQKRSWSCGPAALKILLSQFDHDVSEEQLIQLTRSTPKAGATHRGMVKAAEALGYKVYSKDNFSEEDLAILLDEQIPVLVDFQGDNGGHYAVAKCLKDTRVILYDPKISGESVHSLVWEIFIRNWYSRRYSDHKLISRWGMVIEPK